MTRDEILNMPAGCKIDHLIAENVGMFDGRYYSRNIQSTMLVVEAMHDRGYWVEMFTQAGPGGSVEYCVEFIPVSLSRPSEPGAYFASTSTFPLAICRAALLTVMEREESLKLEE